MGAYVSREKGNYDYLSFADLDYRHPDVINDVKRWGEWIFGELGLSGIRFDAVKHYSEGFLAEFINHIDTQIRPGWFSVGEYITADVGEMTEYLGRMGHKFSLFDFPLAYNFSALSRRGSSDLRTVFDSTLVRAEPYNAVTFVMNHDTQPYRNTPTSQTEIPVEDWFKALAYCFILLRSEGYPCIFYGDLYGMKDEHGNDRFPPAFGGKLPELVLARKLYAYGVQQDYFGDANCVGMCSSLLAKPVIPCCEHH